MGLIGSIVGGVTSSIGGIFAGKAARKAYNEAIKQYQDRMNQIRSHRDALYYQDPTQTAENQAALTEAKQMLDAKTQQIEGSNAVTGGTDESVALAKQSVNDAAANMLQAQALQGARQKEAYYQSADREISQMNDYIAKTKMEKGLKKAQAITDAAGGLANVVNSIDFGGAKLGKLSL